MAVRRTVARVLSEHDLALCKAASRGGKTLLEQYGATNEAEFFAVATEAFFGRPTPLQTRAIPSSTRAGALPGQDTAANAADPGEAMPIRPAGTPDREARRHAGQEWPFPMESTASAPADGARAAAGVEHQGRDDHGGRQQRLERRPSGKSKRRN